MNLERELAKLVEAWRKTPKQSNISRGISQAEYDALGELERFARDHRSALRDLTKSPPQLDGVPTVPGWYWHDSEYGRKVVHLEPSTIGGLLAWDGPNRVPISLPRYAGTWHGPLPEPEGP